MSAREVRLQAPAKINLNLRVLFKRPDGYHELRTVFQTISLSDRLVIRYRPARKLTVSLQDSGGIADNIVLRAAHLCAGAMRCGGDIEMELVKRVPIGAGLGGGSSDAAAVLLALPVLAGKSIPAARLSAIASQLGSDVPFFLQGGTALGLGRGEELYPLPDTMSRHAVLLVPDLAVSTATAYGALSRTLLPAHADTKIAAFESEVWDGGGQGKNDFEPVVFALHPKLKLMKSQLERSGSICASMTGSGSAIFGLFEDREQAGQACQSLALKYKGENRAFLIRLLSRGSYRNLWRRQLQSHLAPDNQIWPPRSLYER